MRVADGKGMIYDNIEDKDEGRSPGFPRKIPSKARWPHRLPSGRGHRHGYGRPTSAASLSAGRNKLLAIMDAGSGEGFSRHFLSAMAWTTNIYEPETGLLFTATREGTLHVFHEDTPDKFSVIETVKTEFGALATWRSTPRRTGFSLTRRILLPLRHPPRSNPSRSPTPVSGTFSIASLRPLSAWPPLFLLDQECDIAK